MKRHALPDWGRMHFKFYPHADCFFIPAGVSGGKPVARKDPFMHWQDVPSHKRNTFMNAVKLVAGLAALFNYTLRELEVEDLAQQDDNDVKVDDIFDEDKDVAEVRQACSCGVGCTRSSSAGIWQRKNSLKDPQAQPIKQP
jgi:hypothetical protein